ncbi:hypothetical protein [Parvularcula sp. LCG005]|uniref:hypothetical protein n=1 Tax=Parvularcula sp. LCG005 TaxID=3078805 RepID=UPI00294354AC|nr:hypothetical protein [Parvularcula sp. LCG005]WOI54323.1 hypothetical protein RUI03_04805 [Parvularcula sp. LCG005]
MAILDEIEAARSRVGVTNRALCARAGLAEHKYSKIKAGFLTLDQETADKLIDALSRIEHENSVRVARARSIGAGRAA